VKSELKASFIQPNNGKILNAFGETICVLLDGTQTGNALTLMFDTTPPGCGPPPHHHENEDELFILVEGRISYFADNNWTEVETGSAVFMPKGVVHCYKNVGETPSKQWILTTPSGFEEFFSRCADEFSKIEGPDMNEITDISREHGIYYHVDS